jgi:hypothetical protein
MASLEKELVRHARHHAVCRRLSSVPGVGVLTAIAFVTAIDDPSRFCRATDVGAYLGLTPRRYQSGEVDRAGRISKRGDRLTGAYCMRRRTCCSHAGRHLLPSSFGRMCCALEWGGKRHVSLLPESLPCCCTSCGWTKPCSTGHPRYGLTGPASARAEGVLQGTWGKDQAETRVQWLQGRGRESHWEIRRSGARRRRSRRPPMTSCGNSSSAHGWTLDYNPLELNPHGRS